MRTDIEPRKMVARKSFIVFTTHHYPASASEETSCLRALASLIVDAAIRRLSTGPPGSYQLSVRAGATYFPADNARRISGSRRAWIGSPSSVCPRAALVRLH